MEAGSDGEMKEAGEGVSKNAGGREQRRWWACGWNTRMRARHSFLQRIFPTQGLNQGLLHCRQILYHLSHQGSSYHSYGQNIVSLAYLRKP